MTNVRRNPPSLRAAGHDSGREFKRVRSETAAAAKSATLYATFGYAYAGTALRYVPWGSRSAEAATPDVLTTFIVPFDGTITEIQWLSSTAGGDTLIEIRDVNETDLGEGSKYNTDTAANELATFTFGLSVKKNDLLAVAVTNASAPNEVSGRMFLEPA